MDLLERFCRFELLINVLHLLVAFITKHVINNIQLQIENANIKLNKTRGLGSLKSRFKHPPPPPRSILILTLPRRYVCCGSLLLLVLDVRIYSLVQLLYE